MNHETQEQTDWIEMHQSQVNMCFLRGLLRWLTEQKNPKFLWSLQNVQRDTMNLAITGQSLHMLKSWYIGGGPGQGSRCCFSDRLNQSLVLSVVQANSNIITRLLLWIHEQAHDIGRHSAALSICEEHKPTASLRMSRCNLRGKYQTFSLC